MTYPGELKEMIFFWDDNMLRLIVNCCLKWTGSEFEVTKKVSLVFPIF